MTTLYIGGKFLGHDSAIFAIFPENRDVFALSTERVTRYKHDDLYPIPALQGLIRNYPIEAHSVTKVFFANAFVQLDSGIEELFPTTRYDAIVETRKKYLASDSAEILPIHLKGKDLSSPELRQFIDQESERIASSLTGEMLPLQGVMTGHLRELFPHAEIIVNSFDHQLCHAMSSRFASKFERCLLITFDGCGDGSFSKIYIASGSDLKLLVNCKHYFLDLSGHNMQLREQLGSPGGVYRYFTFLLGFQPDADEGKVEALAALGQPDPQLLEELLSIFSLDNKTGELTTHVSTAERVLNWDRMLLAVETLGRDVMAATVQSFLENILLSYAEHAIERTGIQHLCLSGGVAANVVVNLKIFEKLSRDIFVVPAMADDGACQGAAILQMLGHGFSYEELSWLRHSYMPYYGTRYSTDEVDRQLADFEHLINRRYIGEAWPVQVAKMVVEGQVGAIFHGRMEWGPRALGNRSIIADPRQANVREVINTNIKRRQAFQPFCPSILEEDRERLFEESYPNKHMTCAFRMKDHFAQQLPGAVHFDGTARVQFVEEADNPLYYRLLREVKNLTGIGCLINTSFNRHGRTIVETPKDAVTDFLDTGLSFLLIEGWLVTRR